MAISKNKVGFNPKVVCKKSRLYMIIHPFLLFIRAGSSALVALGP